MNQQPEITLYTDGGALGNPGPGGYGAVLLYKSQRKELSGGFRRTTNNRMELMAAISGLESLKAPCRVTVYTDSRYVADAVEKGWAKRWRAAGWMRNKKDPALNPDLWERLLNLLDRHEVEFRWVKGHAGNRENERCDALTQESSHRPDLPPDTVYEQETGGW